MSTDDVGARPDREALLRALENAGVRYIVIGGAALETHHQPHRTLDLDITPAAEPDDLDRLAEALNALHCELVTDVDDPASWVALPRDYFTAATLGRATVWNLHTEHGPLDVTFTPSGFPGGFDDLDPKARPLMVAGTTITVAVAALEDVEHSKRVADRPKDREYLERVGRAAPGDSERRP
jgi:hypothetical protein